MELLEKEMHMLFPTALFTGRTPDISMCDRAEKKLLEMRKLGLGTNDDGVYITPDDIHVLPEFKELADLVMLESHEILNVYRIKRDSHYITNMWANITHPNHRHHMHIHPNCLLSGIFYVRMPEKCGPHGIWRSQAARENDRAYVHGIEYPQFQHIHRCPGKRPHVDVAELSFAWGRNRQSRRRRRENCHRLQYCDSRSD